MILDIPKPPLNDLGLGVADDRVGHLDAEPFKYRRRRVYLLAILRFFGPVAKASDVVGQKLAAIIHIDVIRDAVLQDTLAQGDQRRL